MVYKSSENRFQADTKGVGASENDMSEKNKSWDIETLAQALIEDDSAGKAFVVEGFSAAQMHQAAPSLRAALETHQLPLFVLDPTGAAAGGSSFVGVLLEYVRLAELRGCLSVDARDLFEFITSADKPTESGLFPVIGGSLYNDTLCRLWAALSRDMPAALLVVNARHCSPSELKTLHHLSSFFFTDPIEQLAPELAAEDRGRGRLVYLRDSAGLPTKLGLESAIEIDLTQDAEDAVRAFLADPQVVRRFIQSTGGDPKHLGDLLESLPGDVQNFWLYRYERLDAHSRSLVELLAVASEPLLVEAVHDAMALMQASEFFARTLRQLTKGGFVSRKMGSGVVQIYISNPDFAHAVVDAIELKKRQAMHQALADAVQAREDGEFSGIFLARHYLAAGDKVAGFEHGKRAVKHLIARRSFEEAKDLLDSLIGAASDPDERQIILSQLIEVHSGLGNPRQALVHCASLAELVDTPATTLRLKCQIGRLLIRVSEYDQAAKLFEKVITETSDPEKETYLGEDSQFYNLWAEGQLGKGEALFLQGKHDQAEAHALRVIERIEACGTLSSATTTNQSAVEMALLQARNLSGKVAVMRGACERGRDLFEKNSALAQQLGWDDEVARAQGNLGLIALHERNFNDALERLERSRRMAPSLSAIRRAHIFINLGIVHQRKANYEQALRFYLDGLRASRQESDDAGYALAGNNLITLYQDIGAFERAHSIIEHLQEFESGQKDTGYLGGLRTVVTASVLFDEQRYTEAIDVFSRMSKSSAEHMTSWLPALELKLYLVEAYLKVGQVAQAQQLVDEFEFPAEDTSQSQLVVLHALARAWLALEHGESEQALTICRGMADLARSAGHRRDALRISSVVARALSDLGRTEEARALLERELQWLQQSAQCVPQAHRGEFARVPIHRDLVELLRELDGEIPSEFRVSTRAIAADEFAAGGERAPVDVDVQSPAFRQWRSRYKDIVGETPRIHSLFRIIDRVADSNASVLLLGESGTGKELMAAAVHDHSARKDGAFVKVNCAAFVDDLLLSELFGHVKGAFTGALSDRAGRFELADGGTIFLDEVGDISPKTQVALLRVLQEGCFEKVGSTETQKVDARLVCATNKNLEEMVQRGEFRLDLYYRLKGVVMELPPLRERRADIPRFANHFAHSFARGQQPKRFSPDVLRFLASYSWPGNIRELQNFVGSVLLFVEGDTVEMSHVHEFSDFFAGGEVDAELPEIDYDLELDTYDNVVEAYQDPEEALVEQIIAEGLSLAKIKTRLESESIRRALIETGGNITRAAAMLQMKRPRLSQIVNGTEDLLALKNELVG
ncbi:tetratricopeptide repeat protein [Bradymonas sediminis]|uniref:Uncharacterized protein n=2 Tax=Bradymonas sediminis TaxID=1548548 RepID=A0A2Z4FHX3_9DELT|nr:hypothetical protein DN745_03665 [Bradymonas sediminis]TDP77622.1 tetratricopeptide repeat protein [Bradymonas sediminis]